ncbi:hypothetical protein [Streptomyces sp. HB2AG]|uniref:hypothetical protein n=1 Tax=Streptomyces sp. HB2AG TaxID=2983400 RepID=UPI0022AA07CD|nr:hypothetical protein [Streptomyces sp. HB2AG]MCZ2524708.1 hypothetical protein [Streptomyces sp. HB2AG]
MFAEAALLESRSLRSGLSRHVHALDKVKALVLLPDGLHVTTRMVADYFEVGERVVNRIIVRHREELESNGFRVLRGADLEEFKSDTLSLYPGSYPQPRSGLALFPRRAVLNVAMLLRDSDVARRVRTYLLDTEAEARSAVRGPAGGSACSSLDRHVEEVAVRAATGAVTEAVEQAFAPVVAQLGELNARMARQTEVVCAMSVRLADVGDDLADLRRRVGAPRRDRRRR